MKRCVNPNCESTFLFGDDKIVCPFCRSRLIDSTSAAGSGTQTITTPDRVSFGDAGAESEDTEFIKEHFRTVECHGRILEIDHQEFFYSNRHKLFNSLIRGEPYQLAHQTTEYTIRVENITEGFSTEVTDFCLFGNYLGRLQVGDEVIVQARNPGNRRVIKSVYDQTTNSVVKPGLQIPAGFIRAVFLLAAVMIIVFICRIAWLFKTGSFGAGLTSLSAVLITLVIFCGGIWLLFRSLFPKRRAGRRR